jgi:peptidoglycan/LPS O-acetylase OafA/YrhL
MSVQIKQEANHFNFIRLFAAFLVFYGHAYIFMGTPIHIFLNHELGILIFFAISGYLISLSWDRDPSVIRYFRRRALRIFPALAVVIILSILVLGPIMTTWNLKDYFSSSYLWLYLKNIILYISYYLPGVFEHNTVPNVVNGSLWSLPVEFFMYILVVVFGQGKPYTKYIVALSFIVFASLTVLWARVSPDMIVIYGTDMREVAKTGTYFWAGALMFYWNLKRFFTFEYFVIAMLFLFFIYQWSYLYSIVSLFLIPFLVLTFGFSKAYILLIFNKFDYSYGFYIYAFPVQQSIIYLYPNISPLLFLTSGFVITMIFAVLSWHYIEQPAMRFKPKKS